MPTPEGFGPHIQAGGTDAAVPETALHTAETHMKVVRQMANLTAPVSSAYCEVKLDIRGLVQLSSLLATTRFAHLALHCTLSVME